MLEKAVSEAEKLLLDFHYARPENREFCVNGAYSILDAVREIKDEAQW